LGLSLELGVFFVQSEEFGETEVELEVDFVEHVQGLLQGVGEVLLALVVKDDLELVVVELLFERLQLLLEAQTLLKVLLDLGVLVEHLLVLLLLVGLEVLEPGQDALSALVVGLDLRLYLLLQANIRAKHFVGGLLLAVLFYAVVYLFLRVLDALGARLQKFLVLRVLLALDFALQVVHVLQLPLQVAALLFDRPVHRESFLNLLFPYSLVKKTLLLSSFICF